MTFHTLWEALKCSFLFMNSFLALKINVALSKSFSQSGLLTISHGLIFTLNIDSKNFGQSCRWYTVIDLTVLSYDRDVRALVVGLNKEINVRAKFWRKFILILTQVYKLRNLNKKLSMGSSFISSYCFEIKYPIKSEDPLEG